MLIILLRRVVTQHYCVQAFWLIQDASAASKQKNQVRQPHVSSSNAFVRVPVHARPVTNRLKRPGPAGSKSQGGNHQFFGVSKRQLDSFMVLSVASGGLFHLLLGNGQRQAWQHGIVNVPEVGGPALGSCEAVRERRSGAPCLLWQLGTQSLNLQNS